MTENRLHLKRFAIIKLILVVACLLPATGLAQEGSSIEGATVVRDKLETKGVIRVIARISPTVAPAGLTLEGRVLETAQTNLESYLSAAGVAKTDSIENSPLVVLELEGDQLDALLASGNIDAIQEDVIEQAYLDDSVPLVNAPDAWNQGARGAGFAVAVLDSGVQSNHPFFGGRVVSEACYSSNVAAHGATTVCPNGQITQTGAGAANPCSIGGCDHGTHVAGIVGGSDSNRSGVAPDVEFIAIQVFSQFTDQPGGPQTCASVGRSSPCILTYRSDQIRGLQRVIDLAGTLDIAAVNMSLGGGQELGNCDTDLRKGLIDQLRNLGIATVIASGNDGFTNAVGAPGCISTAVTVGSTTKNDAVSGFSNSSSLVDLLAPGSAISSSVTGGGFGSKNGTSMATPHVAGAFAVIRSSTPGATVDNIENALEATGQPITDSRNNLTLPRIDVGQAIGQIMPVVTLTLDDPGRRLKQNETMGISAEVTQAGAPMAGAAVNFRTADATLLTVSPVSATTDALGVAQATVRGESTNQASTSVTAELVGTNSQDTEAVLVPDLSYLGFLFMLLGLAAVIVLGSRNSGSR